MYKIGQKELKHTVPKPCLVVWFYCKIKAFTLLYFIVSTSSQERVTKLPEFLSAYDELSAARDSLTQARRAYDVVAKDYQEVANQHRDLNGQIYVLANRLSEVLVLYMNISALSNVVLLLQVHLNMPYYTSFITDCSFRGE
jgi:hypothetical protein